MKMNLSREFTARVGDQVVHFEAVYDPSAHFFTVTEDQTRTYKLLFDMESREWSTAEGPEPSVPVNELANMVQQSFGVFV